MRDRLKLIVLVCCVACLSSANAQDKRRSDTYSLAEENVWIEAFKNFKTADGATVIQVLDFVQKLRPKEFKYFFEPDTSGFERATGSVSVGVNFYIGMKRLHNDHFGANADGKITDGKIALTFRQVPGSAQEALSFGRDAFLLYIDGEYKDICIDVVSKRKIC